MSDDLEIPVETSFTPRELVGELDRYIVGQHDAKKAVAVALRNRWRRRQVPQPMHDEITPKNIIMIGATGVGKTEIARRLAKLARAPFIKVEASKFTEVGYVGRDVESMVRDLVEAAVGMVKEEERIAVHERARAAAMERVLDLLVGGEKPGTSGFEKDASSDQDPRPDDASEQRKRTRRKFRDMIAEGKLDDRRVSVETSQNTFPSLEIFSSQGGVEEMGMQFQDLFGNLLGKKKTQRREVPISDALELFTEEEAQKLMDTERVVRLAKIRAEQTGIIFIDEIDKVAGGRSGSMGPDVSRGGVQRDLLPIIEGSTVSTKYGAVKTDHVLFIAAGAFHVAKVTDLIPELQGRFPIRVELNSLDQADLLRILSEPENSLPKQYSALMGTEGVPLTFEDGALEAIAEVAASVNRRAENIGARRLHTVMEKMLEDLSFRAPELPNEAITITRAYVEERLKDVLEDENLERYIL
ncbi:MAG: ATP-dependent HslUV protease ATP-binding subunit HslU [Myxococcota bacterium]|jgi:ATP-dependent HslUV protease ATP-binding subunit HslU